MSKRWLRQMTVKIQLRFSYDSVTILLRLIHDLRFRYDSVAIQLWFSYDSGTIQLQLRINYDSAIIQLRFRYDSVTIQQRFSYDSGTIQLRFSYDSATIQGRFNSLHTVFAPAVLAAVKILVSWRRCYVSCVPKWPSLFSCYKCHSKWTEHEMFFIFFPS